MRNTVLFNENWGFVKEASDAYDAAAKAEEPVSLPHTWNAFDGQDGGDDYYRGTCWYVKKVSKADLLKEAGVSREDFEDGKAELWLEFDGVAFSSVVYVNGSKIISHEAGYSRFRVNLTDALSGLSAEDAVEIVVSADNGRSETVYPQKADFTFYGGIYRDVKLVAVPKAHFALGYRGTCGLKITPIVDLSTHDATVTMEARTEGGEGQEVTFRILDADVQEVAETSAPVADGRAAGEIILKNAHL